MIYNDIFDVAYEPVLLYNDIVFALLSESKWLNGLTPVWGSEVS